MVDIIICVVYYNLQEESRLNIQMLVEKVGLGESYKIQLNI